MKNIIVVTGGAGFVGSNLIEELIKIKKYKILSIDNYSSGKISNHFPDPRVKYLRGDTKNISDVGDVSEIILEKSTTSINKSNITIINDLKNIISHTSECSSDRDIDKREYLNNLNNPHNLSQSHKKDDDILKLKSKIDELEKLLYDNIKFDKLNEICIDMTKGNIENIHCWWCCSNFDHFPVGIPNNYRDDTFYTYGYFCSFNCAKAHNLDNVDNKTEEKNCLLMMLKKKLTSDDVYIKPANPRYSLKIFGGYQTIEEYRKDFKMIDKTIYNKINIFCFIKFKKYIININIYFKFINIVFNTI
jgi:hypothetical protein